MLLRLVAAVVLILFAAPIARVLSNAVTPAVQRASSGVAERAAPALDGLPDAAPGPSALAVPTTTTETTAPATPVGVDAPPTVTFECASPAGGWTAAMVATQYVQDPDGYHTWYRIGGEGNLWTYVGKFRSGLDTPPVWSGIAPSSSVEIRYDREMLLDPETSAGYEFFTTGADC